MLNNKLRIPKNNLIVLLAALLAALALTLVASLGTGQEIKVKKTPIRFTDPSSAKEMYTQYCAVCHGVDGKGNGPAASEFKQPPTDLTLLARNNNGKYPEDKVYSTLKFGTAAPAHGTLQMPIWIDLFRSIDKTDSVPQLRMHNLVEYIKGIQAK